MLSVIWSTNEVIMWEDLNLKSISGLAGMRGSRSNSHILDCICLSIMPTSLYAYHVCIYRRPTRADFNDLAHHCLYCDASHVYATRLDNIIQEVGRIHYEEFHNGQLSPTIQFNMGVELAQKRGIFPPSGVCECPPQPDDETELQRQSISQQLEQLKQQVDSLIIWFHDFTVIFQCYLCLVSLFHSFSLVNKLRMHVRSNPFCTFHKTNRAHCSCYVSIRICTWILTTNLKAMDEW